MKEKLLHYKNKINDFWGNRSKTQKLFFVGTGILLVLAIGLGSFFATRETLVPLYSNLSPQETGQIKETLDARGIQSEIKNGGTSIYVPKELEDSLKVELAAEGIPDSGNIDYSFFGENAGFGMTDQEFDVMKLDATQTELSNLIKSVDGINDAKVMITLPEKSIWVDDQEQTASASIVLNTQAGYKFKPEQIRALYYLVSKSIPNLPTDNIVITNQFFDDFSLIDQKNNSTLSAFEEQHQIKRQIEQDIQRQVQQMLGMMMGRDKVVVSVSADVDFTQENREETLVEPVDKENMEGIAVSVERITETFTGNGDQAGGLVANEQDIQTYQGATNGSNGDYEKIEERINNDVNRIRKEISESPYKVRDLGIQVMVEPPVSDDPTSLSNQSVNDIKQILSTIVRTTIAKDEGQDEISDQEILNKVFVSVQPFNGKQTVTEKTTNSVIPLWVYIAGGILLAFIILLIFMLIRRKRHAEDDGIELTDFEQQSIHLPDVNDERESEEMVRRKQLERMAKEKPEDFAKLLRTWLAED